MMRRLIVPLLILTVPLGLTFLLTSTLPAVAEPVGVTPLPPVAETDGYGGICFSYYPDPQTGSGRPFIQKALDAGSRWDRFPFDWYRIEPTNGAWSSEAQSAYDNLVNDLDTAGMNMVGILLGTPDWAASTSVLGDAEIHPFGQRPVGWHAPVIRTQLVPMAISATSSPPQGLYEEWNDWTTLDGDPVNYWGRFVYQVVDRYGDRVKYWEMWNEAEWNVFWSGSDADYAQLLKVGYQSTKAACSNCTVLFAGLHYWIDPTFFERVLDTLNNDPQASTYNYFFDVMSVHFYSRSSNAYDMVNHVRSRMTLYVPDHPIWLTETNVPVWNDSSVDPDLTKYDFAATQEEAAAYVIQSYANARASGVERYIFFRTHDENMGEYFGLIRNDHSFRPAYVACQVATAYLISPTFTTRVPTGAHVRVTLWGTPRGKVSVLWNESPTASTYTLAAALDTATLVDRWGATQTVAAAGGVYSLTLPGATANLVSDPDDYFIGGDPLIVIESETANEPPTSTVRPLPSVTCSSTFAVAWEGRDNQAGVWLYDVQARDGESGVWSDWREMTTSTSSQFVGQDGHTYYFRSRALDRLGNRGSWPDQPQAHTTVQLPRPLHLSVGDFFADENGNDAWDLPIAETGEITLTNVMLRFMDGTGQYAITPTVSNAFTTTICAERLYWLLATSDDHMRGLPLAWPQGGETYTETYPALGLWPMSRSYLPLVLRDE
jgi:hypothetical protein